MFSEKTYKIWIPSVQSDFQEARKQAHTSYGSLRHLFTFLFVVFSYKTKFLKYLYLFQFIRIMTSHGAILHSWISMLNSSSFANKSDAKFPSKISDESRPTSLYAYLPFRDKNCSNVLIKKWIPRDTKFSVTAFLVLPILSMTLV